MDPPAMRASPTLAATTRTPSPACATGRAAGPSPGDRRSNDLVSEDGADLVLEGRDVIGHDRAGALGLAGADRLEQLDVLVHAGRQMRQALEHEVPDPQGEVEVAPERLLEVGVRRAAVHEAMDAGVEHHQRGRILAVAAGRQGDAQL